MTEKVRKQTSPIAHIVSIILAFVSTIFLFLVVLYNVPFSSADKSNLPGRMRLLTVSPDKGMSGKTHGFGIWGWCSWTDGANWGDCVNKRFWQLPGDAGNDSVVRSLDLPSIFILLLLTIHFHARAQPSIREPISLWPPSDKKMRTFYAMQLRNVWWRMFGVISILAWGLPGIIIAAVGASDVQNGWHGSIGVGWGLELASMFLLIIVQGLILLGGLWNNPSHSGRKK
ncbi:hypothetical protein I306_02679 [Cryptococcus gattii EJB2]|uniref:Uncharacterized protein n=1 Tax=Cryptococcus gattii EJB2 TaxID=1296103 RepID=A0ABR5BX87_9TREE|nr:hypothetical protein I306_02679 [Cryptococcus gattii EJB2]